MAGCGIEPAYLRGMTTNHKAEGEEMSESLSQMVDRLIKDHRWDRYTALCAAEYYLGHISFTQLVIRLGQESAQTIGDMRERVPIHLNLHSLRPPLFCDHQQYVLVVSQPRHYPPRPPERRAESRSRGRPSERRFGRRGGERRQSA